VIGYYRGLPVHSHLTVSHGETHGTFNSTEAVESFIDKLVGDDWPKKGWMCSDCAECGEQMDFFGKVWDFIHTYYVFEVICAIELVAFGNLLAKGGML